MQVKLLPLSQSSDTRKPGMLAQPVTQTKLLMQTHSSGCYFGVTSRSLWKDFANASHIHATIWLETWGAEGKRKRVLYKGRASFYCSILPCWFIYFFFSLLFPACLLVCGPRKMKHSYYLFFPVSIRCTAANTNFILSTGCWCVMLQFLPEEWYDASVWADVDKKFRESLLTEQHRLPRIFPPSFSPFLRCGSQSP